MPDRLTPAQRSALMGRIQGGPRNKLQRAVHGWLCAKHVRHKCEPNLGAAGRPDFAVYAKRGRRTPILLVFVDGCFWHGCPWHYREPKANAEYWRRHIGENRARDARRAALPYMWAAVWEHQVTGRPGWVSGSYKSALWWSIREAYDKYVAGQAPLAAYAP